MMGELTAEDVKKARQEYQSRTNSPAAMEELKEHAETLVKWLWNYHTPHTEIRITWDEIRLYDGGAGFPVPYAGEK